MPLVEHREFLLEWLKKKMHGEMHYMERNLDKRTDPRLLVKNAKSIISILLNYYPGNPNVSISPPKISRYALSTDYHKVIKDLLYKMLDQMRDKLGEINGRAFVDSAPVLERAWAVKSGLGWIGKNSMLIHPKLGSYTFIGQLIVDIEIEPTNQQISNRCGSCSQCIDACPTGAIVNPGVIDVQKCISYLSIEKKTPLNPYEKNSLNGWCFGCDICQEVCPWNSKISKATLAEIQPLDKIVTLDFSQLKNFTSEDLTSIFMQTPIERVSTEKLLDQIQSTHKE